MPSKPYANRDAKINAESPGLKMNKSLLSQTNNNFSAERRTEAFQNSIERRTEVIQNSVELIGDTKSVNLAQPKNTYDERPH